MLTKIRCLVLLALLTGCRIGASENHNYMIYSNAFGSLSAVEDLIIPEVEIMKNLETLKDQMAKSSKILEEYIDNWKEMNMAAALEDKKYAMELFLKNRKTISGFDLIEADGIDGNNEEQNNDDSTNSAPSNNTANSVQDLKSSSNKTLSDINQLSTQIKPELSPEMEKNILDLLMTPPKKKLEGSGIYHPVDGYLLIKRLSVGWKPLRDTLTQLSLNASVILKNIEKSREDFYFPGTADLNGAAVALARLQDLYNMDMNELSTGIINKKFTHGEKDLKSLGKLRPWDLILLGKQAYNLGLTDRAIDWFKEAVRSSKRLKLQDEEKTLIPRLRKTILKNDSLEPREETKIKKPPAILGDLSHLHDTTNQDRLCAGETLLSIEEQSKLHCSYERVSLYFTLMPLKVEVVHDVPRVVLIHDFITENQSDIMKKRARPYLSPSTHASNAALTSSMIRVSMTSWIDDHILNSSDPIKKVTRKIEATTAMEASNNHSAEVFQVLNYGMGGLYKYHADHGANANTPSGDRLLTFLIYLNDVQGGGATVFTRLGIRVKPERGMALMWYNLLKSEKSDPLTYHAACPLLHGNKWIVTKWIHVREQIFNSPCGLKEDERFTFP